MTVRSAEPAGIADVVAECVDAALARVTVESRRLTIAGAGIEMTAGRDAASFIFAPFAHLEVPHAGAPALRVEVAALQDSDARALALDEVPDSGVVLSAAGRIVHLHRHSAAVFDRMEGRIRALVRSASGVASWHRAKPLQLLLSIFFADRNVDLLHGGLVSLNGLGLLIAGAGGAGKSTLTIASLLEGFDFLGDDCVGVEKAGGQFVGHSVYGSGCLERAHLRRFPRFGDRSAVAGAGEDSAELKAVLPIAELFAGRLAVSTAIRAIVLPRVTRGARVTVRPASGREALLALAPGSILKRAVPAAGTLARMTRMAGTLPPFWLEMGPVEEAGPAMRALARELAS